MSETISQAAMPMVDALAVLDDLRDEQIVITTMGSARDWPRVSDHPLDFHFIPSSMGQAPAVALGLALAQPQRGVWVLNGDGCMLMNLGSLVTIAASGASNLTVFVCDNGIYEVTGGQTTSAAVAGVDYCGLAKAAGLKVVASVDDLSTWRELAPQLLAQPGPRFVHLRVEPVGDDYQLQVPGPMADRIAKFRAALGT